MITERIIKKSDMPVSRWSGGATTQIAIYPYDADYSERAFIWRASTATIDADTSDFTALPDYWRIIASVEGEMTLFHDDEAANVILPQKTVHSFDGAARTRCIGGGTDINLMLQKDAAAGSIELLKDGDTRRIVLTQGCFALLYQFGGDARLYHGEGELKILASGDSALFIALVACPCANEF